MGMKSSFVYGIGFEIGGCESNIVSFIKAHKDTFCVSDEEKKLYNLIENNDENLEDLFETKGYSCENSGMGMWNS